MMDKTFKVRTAELSGTGRSSLRLEESTWAAIDSIALRAGVRWQDWAREIIRKKPHFNKTGVIRAAVAEELMADQFVAMAQLGFIADSISEPHAVLGAGYYRLDDAQLKVELEGADVTTQDDSFGAFVLYAGTRAPALGGEPFVVIQNQLKGFLHLMIAPAIS
jgi:predicted DNA-binding ribbon-helix-helix protein